MLVLCMIWFAHKYGSKYHVDFMWLVDHLAIAVAFAGAFIRLGNLCNSEIYGDVTSLPWPTQIYESLSYFILGLILVWIYVKRLNKTYRGTFIGIFFIVCFGMRFLIEFIKEPQVEFEESMALDMGQWLSMPFVILGIASLVWAYKKKIPAAAIIPDENPRKSDKSIVFRY